MNRRSIFKLLVGAACAAAIEITGVVPSLPKAAKYVINPEWLSAAYEDVVCFNSSSLIEHLQNNDGKSVIGHVLRIQRAAQDEPASLSLSKSHPEVLPDAHPFRYNLINGEYQPIPQYILES